MAGNTVQCPSCSATLRLKAAPKPGAKIRCPKCQQVFAPQSDEEEYAEEYAEEIDDAPPPPRRSAPPPPRGGRAAGGRPAPARGKGKKGASGGTPIGLIIGIVAGVLVLGGVGVGGFLWWRSQSSGTAQVTTAGNSGGGGGAATNNSTGGGGDAGSGVTAAAGTDGAESPQAAFATVNESMDKFQINKALSVITPNTRLLMKTAFVSMAQSAPGQSRVDERESRLQAAFAKRNVPFDRMKALFGKSDLGSLAAALKEQDLTPAAYDAITDFLNDDLKQQVKRNSEKYTLTNVSIQGDRATATVSDGGSSRTDPVEFERIGGRWYVNMKMGEGSDEKGPPRKTRSGPSGKSATEKTSSNDGPPPGGGAVVPLPELTNSVGMKLKLIPAGTFTMGSERWMRESNNDNPPRPVRLTKAYFLGVHEVTVDQFTRFVAESGYKPESETGSGTGYDPKEGKNFMTLQARRPEFNWKNPGFPQTAEHPVVNVTWNDAVAYCDWLSKKEKKKYRLPTEAEWEYACRAETITRYSFGENEDEMVRYGNVADSSFKAKLEPIAAVNGDDKYAFTAPVRSFQPNGFGLYDMHGNVGEWCSDWYDDPMKARPEPKLPLAAATDPKGPETGKMKVVRSGVFFLGPEEAASASRNRTSPGQADCTTGFRVALTSE